MMGTSCASLGRLPKRMQRSRQVTEVLLAQIEIVRVGRVRLRARKRPRLQGS
jgi:hypothetical protein